MQVQTKFEQSLKNQDLSAGTVKGYKNDLQQFIRWLENSTGKKFTPAQITQVDLLSYRSYLQHQKRFNATTINRKINSLKKFCHWAQTENLISDNPGIGIRQIKMTQRHIAPRYLTRNEINALLRSAQQCWPSLRKRNYALLQLLLQTGIRLGELRQLYLEDIKISDRSGSIRIQGKGNKERVVPLNNSVRKAITEYLSSRQIATGPLFLSQRHKAISTREIQNIMENLLRSAGLTGRGFSTHSLRHTFATHYLQDHPGDLVGLATLLGHSNLNSTAIYTQPSAGELTKKVEASSLNIF